MAGGSVGGDSDTAGSDDGSRETVRSLLASLPSGIAPDLATACSTDWGVSDLATACSTDAWSFHLIKHRVSRGSDHAPMCVSLFPSLREAVGIAIVQRLVR